MIDIQSTLVFLCVNDQEKEQLTSFGLVVVLWFWGAAA
jgi:hypothetical protein